MTATLFVSAVTLATLFLVWRRAAGSRRGVGELADLPVRYFGRSETPSGEPARVDLLPLVVFLTSDSGWLQLNSALPAELARAGYNVVAWNSLRYYLKRRTPEEAARDLERILDHFGGGHEERAFSVIGYSFGAGVLPFLVNRLTADWRSHLQSVVYLAYPGSAMFKFKPTGWLLRIDDDAIPARDEVARLPSVPSLCVAGESDPIRDCRSIEPYGVRRHLLEIGHGLHPRTSEVIDLVLETLREGAGTRGG